MNKSRVARIRQELIVRGIDGLLLSNMINVKYISGFKGSYGFCLLTKNGAFLLTDSRYILQARNQAECLEVIEVSGNLFEKINDLIIELEIRTLGFEEHTVTYSKYEELRLRLNIEELVPAEEIVTNLRKIKDTTEIERIKRAAQITDFAFSHIIEWIKPGMTELEVALELEYYMRRNGASSVSFDIIVASGHRSALPHGIPSDKKIEVGDFVIMDFGCIYEGYCSDMTRTIGIGHLDAEQKRIYDIVLTAQLEALKFICPGKSGIEVDEVAREIIKDDGYGDSFGHGLGHGVGLEIHEAPTLSPRGKEILQPNMVVTVEPGIYIENFGGVRIEDLVVVKGNRISNLTTSKKELIII